MCSPLLGTLEGQGSRVVSARAGQARGPPTHYLPKVTLSVQVSPPEPGARS